MSNFTTLYNTAGLPTGTIVRGRINDPTWLPMNGGLYLKADYPELDTSQYLTFGNNTVQTASGTVIMQGTDLSSFAHNADYTRLVLCDTLNSTCRSTDGGLTWSNFTIPGMATVTGINFLNGQFVAYSPASFATSTNLTTWSAASSWSFPSSLNTIAIVEYFNGLYIVFGSPTTSGQVGIYTSATLTSGSFSGRWNGIEAGTTFTPLANNNLRRGVVNGAVLRVGRTTEGAPGIISTIDGINFQQSLWRATSPILPTNLSITSSGFLTTKDGQLISYTQGAAEVGGDNLVRLAMPYTQSTLINFGNLFAHMATGDTVADRLLVSESKYYQPNTYLEILPAAASAGHRCAFTPTRLIIIPSNGASSGNAYYLNIDTARFRLERPLIDGHFVDDAYIKAA